MCLTIPSCSASDREQERGREDNVMPPKLVVLIAVDQMRDAYFDDYRDHFSGGLKRLQEAGFRFENSWVDHAPSNSLPGHASLATGAYPSRHGVIDNSWIEWREGDPVVVGALRDQNYTLIGAPEATGRSPRSIEVDGLADWVLAAHPDAKAVSIGTGTVSTGANGGQTSQHVYWYNGSVSRYVTSTYYRASLPEWVTTYNQQLEGKLSNYSSWEPDERSYPFLNTLTDAREFEADGVNIVFPHNKPDSPDDFGEWAHGTPFADATAIELAQIAIEAEGLGKDEVTDYLGVVLSSLDDVGHVYGPNSAEQYDALIRLDRILGELFELLDQSVGPEHYLVALSADHGVADAPEVSGKNRYAIDEVRTLVASAQEAADSARLSGDNPRAAAAAVYLDSPFVERLIYPENMAAPKDEIEQLYANSFRPGRTSRHPFYGSDGVNAADHGFIIVTPEGDFPNWAAAIHGTAYDYDRQVPIFFYGAGITSGCSQAMARTIDVAPTLAMLASIEETEYTDGVPLSFVESAACR